VPWPVLWGGLLLSGLAWGEWCGAEARRFVSGQPLDGEHAVRLACAAPLATALSAHPATLLGAGAVTVAMGWYAGCRWSDEGAARRAVVCADPWSPSRRLRWRAGAVLRVSAWPRVREDRWRAPAVLVAIGPMEGGGPDVAPRPGDGVMVTGDGPPPDMWQTVGGVLECCVPKRAALPGAFSPLMFLRGRGLDWEGRLTRAASFPDADDLLDRTGKNLFARLRTGIAGGLDVLYPPLESRLLQSVLLGERSDGMRPLRDAYAVLGLGHLFAVSGLHVGLVAGILLLLLRALRAGAGSRFCAMSLFLAVYVLLVGLPGSSLRAAALLVTASLAAWTGRRQDALRTLGLLVWTWGIFAPVSLTDAGLRLSLGAAAGILIALRLVTPRLPARPRIRRWLVNALAVSIGAQLGALPETVRSFGWIHPLATAFNLGAVPFFGGAVWLAAASLLLSPLAWLAEAIAGVAWLMLRLLSAGAALLSGLAGLRIGLPLWDERAAALFATGILGAGVAIAGRGPRLRLVGALAGAALMCLPFVGRTVSGGDMIAVQFDVGQGDCALLVFPDRSAILIDTGESWRGTGPFLRDVAPWLRREGIDTLAGVVLTHHHADHDGAAGQVAASLDVRSWWLGGATQQPPGVSASIVSRPAPGDTLHRAGDWSLVCIAAERDSARAENDRSLVVALCRAARVRGLWTGDLEAAGERDLLAGRTFRPGGPIDVIKAGHHGSRTSGAVAFLEALRPETVLISCGLENRHKHPSHGPYVSSGDTLACLRTDLDGTLVMRWHGGDAPDIRRADGFTPLVLTPGVPARNMPATHPETDPNRPQPQANEENHPAIAQHRRSGPEPGPDGQGP